MRIGVRLRVFFFLVLLCMPLTAVAVTRTWTGHGTDNLWSNPANWDSGIPANGDDLLFSPLCDPGCPYQPPPCACVTYGPYTTFNDLNGLELHSIGASVILTLNGNRIRLGAGGISGTELTVGLPVTLTASQEWRVSEGHLGAWGGSLAIAGDVDLGTSSLSIVSTLRQRRITVSGTITGGGALSFDNYEGVLTVDGHINTGGPVSFGPFLAVNLNDTNSFPGPLTFEGDWRCSFLNVGSPNALVPGIAINGHHFGLNIGPYTVQVGTMNVGGPGWCALLVSDGGTLAMGGAGTGTALGPIMGTGRLVVTSGSQTLVSAPGWPNSFAGSLDVTGGSLTLTSKAFGAVSAAIGPGRLKLEGSSLGAATVTGGTLELAGGFVPGTSMIARGQVSALSMDAASTLIEYIPPFFTVGGAISLGNATLVVQPGLSSATAFTIIQNDGTAPVGGTFAGLPEGAKFVVNGTQYRISYYGGDGNDVTATAIAPTQTTLATAPNPSRVHQPVTLTASVSSAAGIPSGGTVKFFDGAGELGSVPLDAPTLTVSSFAAGTHHLTATYLGTDAFESSTSPPVDQVVIDLDATKTVLTAIGDSAPLGRAVTLTATVSSERVVVTGGEVTFFDGAMTLGTRSLGTSGAASLTTDALALGTHTLTARYGGTSEVGDSTSDPIPFLITRAPTELTLSTSPNPSTEGSPVTLTATVSPHFQSASGIVTFLAATDVIGKAAVNASGTAALATSFSSDGIYDLSASYGGSEVLLPSTSPAIRHLVGPPAVPTTTELAAVPNPAWAGRPVSLKATVHAAGKIPGGKVELFDGSSRLESAALDEKGEACFTASFTAGTHVLLAAYGGTLELASSSGSVLVNVVEPVPTQTTLTASPNPSQHEQPIELSAVVRAAGGVPHGTIVFSSDGASLGNAPLDDSGRAFLTTSALADGLHALVALYLGADGFEASASPPVPHEVLPGPAACSWPVFVPPLGNFSAAWRSKVTLTASMKGDQPLTCEWYMGKYPETSKEIESTSITPTSSSVTIEDLTESAELWVLATNACGSAHASMTITVLPPARKRVVPH